MPQIPGHFPQATQAVRMHCAASDVTRSARVVLGSLRSSRSTAADRFVRHLRFWADVDPMIAETANIAASCMTTMTQAPPSGSGAHRGVRCGQTGAQLLKTKLGLCNRKRLVSEDSYFARRLWSV